MAKKEANFDLYIHDLLVEAGIQADTQGSNVFEINNALKTASKHQTGNTGHGYKLSKYCSNEGNIYTESLGQLAYQNNPKFKKFIADNGLNFKAYDQFGKAEITERVALLVQLVRLVWNDEMFK